jgi:hypothetical protein
MRVRGIAPGALVVAVVAWGLRDHRLPAAIASWGQAACGDSASVSWEPGRPRLGALFTVRVTRVPDESRLSGGVAGEPLQFTRPADGSASSIAALPIDGPSRVAVTVRCAADRKVDSLAVTVDAGAGDYTIERLTVAPAFGRAPDSALLARTRRESQRALAVAEGAHDTPRLWRDPFVMPRAARVTSGFGHGREFNGTITSRHMGTDFAGAPGAPVVAANRGVVRIVGAFYYGGNVVYLDHGAGLTSAYLHLSRQLVAAGDTVERGQEIGFVGATGRVTGPHLHLIVRYGSVTVDPLSLFEVAGDSAGRTLDGPEAPR